MKCCICGKEIELKVYEIGSYEQGHNAAPVKEGKCCSECNTLVVIPARLKSYFEKREAFRRKR